MPDVAKGVVFCVNAERPSTVAVGVGRDEGRWERAGIGDREAELAERCDEVGARFVLLESELGVVCRQSTSGRSSSPSTSRESPAARPYR